MIEKIAAIVSMGIACGFISFCIADSQFFSPLRNFFLHRKQKPTILQGSSSKKFFTFAYDLLSCPYCLSHWVALVMVLIWQPRVTNGPLVADLIVSLFVIVGIANYSWTKYLKMSSGQ